VRRPLAGVRVAASWHAGAGVEAAFADTARRALARKEQLAAEAAAELGASPGVPSAPPRPGPARLLWRLPWLAEWEMGPGQGASMQCDMTGSRQRAASPLPALS